jgi:hypothetical protein
MRGEIEMTFNANYAELLGRELQRDRMREAERERLIRQVSGWNPGLAGKLLIVLQEHWSKFWSRVSRKKGYIPISQLPKNSPSI